jgi:hypothetical protein
MTRLGEALERARGAHAEGRARREASRVDVTTSR